MSGSGASTASGWLAPLPDHGRQSTQRLVNNGAIWEDVQKIRIDNRDVRTLGVPHRGHSTNCARKVVLGPKSVTVRSANSTSFPLHTASAHASLHVALK